MIHFFTFSYTIGVFKVCVQDILPNFNLLRKTELVFFNLSFREFTAAINFPFSKSGLRIGENDVIFSKIPNGLKL